MFDDLEGGENVEGLGYFDLFDRGLDDLDAFCPADSGEVGRRLDSDDPAESARRGHFLAEEAVARADFDPRRPSDPRSPGEIGDRSGAWAAEAAPPRLGARRDETRG